MLRLLKGLIVQKGMLVSTGIHLSVPFIKKGIANLGAYRTGWKRTKEATQFCCSRQKNLNTPKQRLTSLR